MFWTKKDSKKEPIIAEKSINSEVIDRLTRLESIVSELNGQFLEVKLNQKLLNDRVLRKIQLATIERQQEEIKEQESKQLNRPFNPFGI